MMLSLMDINPHVRVAGTYVLTFDDRHHTFKNIKTLDSRLFYILDGSGTMKIENKLYPLHNGSFIMFSSQTEYAWQPDISSYLKYIAINFDYTQNHSDIKASLGIEPAECVTDDMALEHVTISDAEFLNSPIFINDFSSAEDKLWDIIEVLVSKGSYYTEMASSLLKSVIVSVPRYLEKEKEGLGIRELNSIWF
ncbi:MAG: hypothetical protein Q8882_09245 [Bacillota bacterium]|nr:hypothetical protein [Bacillota bacterium]